MSPYVLMLAGAASFTLMSELAHVLNKECHWTVVALARTALAFLFTFVLAKSQGIPLVFWRPHTLWLRSIAGSISLMCAFYAFKNLPASDVVVITNMFPIWVAILSWPMLGERPGPEVWPAVFCSVAGAALVNYPLEIPVEVTTGPPLDRTGGAIAACISSVLSAVVVIGLNLLQNVPSQAVVVHFSGVATVFCLAIMPWVGADGSFHFAQRRHGHQARGHGLLRFVGANLSHQVVCRRAGVEGGRRGFEPSRILLCV
ncbi:MAG: EamA family transporter [Pirellulales bacterium]